MVIKQTLLGELMTGWLSCGEAQMEGFLLEQKGCLLVWDTGIQSLNAKRTASQCTPDWCALCSIAVSAPE